MSRKIDNIFTKKAIMLGLVLILTLTGQRILGCDADDELPGALPPAPNGGELGEADLLDKTAGHSPDASATEPKLYWEGVHLKRERQIHLTLVSALPPKTAIFTVLSPQKEFSGIEVKVEIPRGQKAVNVPFSVKEDRIIVDFDGKDLNRFIIHVSGNRKGIARKALVQIEEE